MSLEQILSDTDEKIVQMAQHQLLRLLTPKERKPIVEWCRENVDMSYDITSSSNGPFKPYPYQIEPLETAETPGVQELTLMWGQRLGKSTIWKMDMLYRVAYGGLSGLIVYPSLELGTKTNEDTVKPLLCTLKDARRDLALRSGKRKASYHMPSLGSVIYFLGGGTQVISMTANWAVLDECDFVKLQKAQPESENVNQLKALRLRMKTFKEHLLIPCSSPSNYSGPIYKNWSSGSRGEWNMRCLHCGRLSPVKQLAYPQADGSFAGLQWEKDQNGNIIEDSIRWICPVCKHSHCYADAFEMNEQGAYEHQDKGNKRHRSFQCGALGNPWIWTWREIAQAQEDAIDPEGKKFLCNSVLGTPYKHIREGDVSISIEDAIKEKRRDYPDDLGERLSIVVAGIDQQKSDLAGLKYYVVAVRGWDEEGNSYLMHQGTANSLEALAAILDATYYGHRVSLALIDQGGFDNAQDLDPFVASRPFTFYYKGDDDKTLKGKPWGPSATNPKLFLANAIYYQVKLLSLLYDPPRPSGYRWHLPNDIPKSYTVQITSVGPNNHIIKDRNGEAYQNWCSTGGARRDFFDAEKMSLVALDVACYYLPPESFVKKNKPLFIRKEWLAAIARAQAKTKG